MQEKTRKSHLIQRRKCRDKYGNTAVLEECAEQEILKIIDQLGKKGIVQKLTNRVIARVYNTSIRRNLKK